MKAKEILELIASPWCSNQDIMKIANLSASTASKVKRIIEMDFRKKNPTKFIPSHCVPTKEVIKYFDLDVEFLKNIANIKVDGDDNE